MRPRTVSRSLSLCLFLLLTCCPSPYAAIPPEDPSPLIPYTREMRPIPDPTTLSSQMILREIMNLRQLLETRIDAVEHTIVKLEKRLDALPLLIDARIAAVDAINAERFRTIDFQFAFRRTAIDAALQAAEKSNTDKNAMQVLANTKVEIGVAEQLKTILQTIATVEHGSTDKIVSLKERLDRLEGQAGGIGQSWGVIISVIGAAGVIIGITLALYKHTHV